MKLLILFLLFLIGHVVEIVSLNSANRKVYFKIKKARKLQNNEVKEEIAKEDSLPAGGPYRIEPWRNIKIPFPLMLNERFKNPKFRSRNPKRNQAKQKNDGNENPGNILNTNYKHAYLKSKNRKVVRKQNSRQNLIVKNVSKKIKQDGKHTELGSKKYRRKLKILRKRKQQASRA